MKLNKLLPHLDHEVEVDGTERRLENVGIEISGGRRDDLDEARERERASVVRAFLSSIGPFTSSLGPCPPKQIRTNRILYILKCKSSGESNTDMWQKNLKIN